MKIKNDQAKIDAVKIMANQAEEKAINSFANFFELAKQKNSISSLRESESSFQNFNSDIKSNSKKDSFSNNLENDTPPIRKNTNSKPSFSQKSTFPTQNKYIIKISENFIGNIPIQLLLIQIQDLIQTIHIENSQDFSPKTYHFVLSDNTNLGLNLSIKKINGKLSITLYADPTLKEELLQNLNQLLTHLQNKGIDLINLNIQDLNKEKHQRQHQNKRKKPTFQTSTSNESDENFSNYLKG